MRPVVRRHRVARAAARLSALEAPILGHFAQDDGFFTPAAVRELEQKLHDLGKTAELVVHTGVDHGFFNDTRPEVYDAATAGVCWQQTVGFLRNELV